MNCREKIYKTALDRIESIYLRSQYNEDIDFYRIYDLVNCVNDAQMKSKEWLVQELSLVLKIDFNEQLKNVLILGSWYGLTSALLRDHVNEDVLIYNIDSDPICKKFRLDNHKNTKYEVADALEFFNLRQKHFELIINTSCEHMDQDDINSIIKNKPFDTMFCFQSNNYHNEPEHINTHNSLEEFVRSLNTETIFYQGELKPSEEYSRYMVIGI